MEPGPTEPTSVAWRATRAARAPGPAPAPRQTAAAHSTSAAAPATPATPPAVCRMLASRRVQWGVALPAARLASSCVDNFVITFFFFGWRCITNTPLVLN